jgi:hypothetical protein
LSIESGVDIPMPQRTDAASVILTAVLVVWRVVWRREVVLVDGAAGFSAGSTAGRPQLRGLTETGELRTPRSAARPRIGSFSQTACPYKVSALSTPLAT